MQAALSSLANVHAVFTGYLQQDQLPAKYAQGKIFCFSTRRDAWGIVANEACASGLPVLTTADAGCAGELIIHGRNGYVLPPDAENWAEHAERLLGDDAMLQVMSANAIESVAEYTYDRAASGIIAACEESLQ
jgi:glycosyltransferase involved in cell wall biosynthesis